MTEDVSIGRRLGEGFQIAEDEALARGKEQEFFDLIIKIAKDLYRKKYLDWVRQRASAVAYDAVNEWFADREEDWETVLEGDFGGDDDVADSVDMVIYGGVDDRLRYSWPTHRDVLFRTLAVSPSELAFNYNFEELLEEHNANSMEDVVGSSVVQDVRMASRELVLEFLSWAEDTYHMEYGTTVTEVLDQWSKDLSESEGWET